MESVFPIKSEQAVQQGCTSLNFYFFSGVQ